MWRGVQRARPEAGDDGGVFRLFGWVYGEDLNANDLDGAVQMIVGSARSMGLEVAE